MLISMQPKQRYEIERYQHTHRVKNVKIKKIKRIECALKSG